MNWNRQRTIVSAVVILIVLSVFILWPEKKQVKIVDGNSMVFATTTLSDICSLLADKGIVLGERDLVYPGLDEPLTNGMTISITRAREVEITAGNEKKVVSTTSYLTKKVLQESDIEIGEYDKVYPVLEGYCLDSVRVVRVEKKEIIEEKTMEYLVQKVNDDSLYNGEKRIKQKGKKGLEKYIYEVVYENGKEVARGLLEKIIVQKPIQEIVAVGTLQSVSRGGQPMAFKEVIEMTATGYTHTGQRTYTDIWPSVGIVAVDPKVIPLRTRLYIDGYGYATAMDIGSAIKGNRIDLFFDSRQEALKWGRRTVKVFVLE